MTSLQSYHTFSLPSGCESLIVITDPHALVELDFSRPFFLIGEGSNTIFLEDYAGTVIKLATLGVDIEQQDDDYIVTVAAGENWHQLVTKLLDNGIDGLENLALIPGTVGAAPVQNIGAYGVEVSQFITAVRGFDIAERRFTTLTNAECEFGYRDSVFKHRLKDKFVITEVTLTLPKRWQPTLSYGPLQSLSDTATAQEICEAVIVTRNSKLPNPAMLANAGSFFKNPVVDRAFAAQLQSKFPEMPAFDVDNDHVKLAAGWLIDKAGLKGCHRGAIRVYEKQALVLVHSGGSTGEDLTQLVSHIQQTVWQKFAVLLEHEVRLITKHGECQLQSVERHENA
ncbi:UDP-N-acetylmuramate dehydrogenase [Pseudoalteromonas sp. A22]|uniref:UDP-N-acetylmuramate dehydrogenase n=1 Tax=Pseudoalteromonas TaxID=53246 RepID=UPI001BAC648B|nr:MULTISPECIES: UDP-N-acetylmuramate dehydrogenase [Pseudoalteromonas]QUI62133.1 UDP-N-acetylmuramate dehydrogenase [Pseudoalteromonas sp. A22]USE67785.1 UDP-N-acetylenolpyruvoylglucosamine reductase [Pseudoalteromonas flavipulchra]